MGGCGQAGSSRRWPTRSRRDASPGRHVTVDLDRPGHTQPRRPPRWPWFTIRWSSPSISTAASSRNPASPQARWRSRQPRIAPGPPDSRLPRQPQQSRGSGARGGWFSVYGGTRRRSRLPLNREEPVILGPDRTPPLGAHRREGFIVKGTGWLAAAIVVCSLAGPGRQRADSDGHQQRWRPMPAERALPGGAYSDEMKNSPTNNHLMTCSYRRRFTRCGGPGA